MPVRLKQRVFSDRPRPISPPRTRRGNDPDCFAHRAVLRRARAPTTGRSSSSSGRTGSGATTPRSSRSSPTAYSLAGEETRGAKVFFREAFFLDPQAVDLGLLESPLVTAVARLRAHGVRGTRAGGVGARVRGHLGGLQRAAGAEAAGAGPAEAGHLPAREGGPPGSEPRLLAPAVNRYFWLIDHYRTVGEQRERVEEVLDRIRELDPRVHRYDTRRRSEPRMASEPGRPGGERTELVKTVTELLNEEKWTRATLNSYSIQNFKDLDALIEQARAEGARRGGARGCQRAPEAHQQLDHRAVPLGHPRPLARARRRLEPGHADQHLHGQPQVERRGVPLAAGSSNSARTSSPCARWRTATRTATRRSTSSRSGTAWCASTTRRPTSSGPSGRSARRPGDAPGAVDYYKRAIHRFVNKQQFNSVKDLWDRLDRALRATTSTSSSHVERTHREEHQRRARRGAAQHAAVPHAARRGDWDTAIEILKRILAYEPKNSAARKDIVECYREKYQAHSQLEEYLRISNLSQSWRSVHEAIADFEKHISLRHGQLRASTARWGIGRIASHQGRHLHHRLRRQAGPQDVAEDGHRRPRGPRPRPHLGAEAHRGASALAARVKADPSWALRTVIKSFGNAADMKRIKAELIARRAHRGGVVALEHRGPLAAEEGPVVRQRGRQGRPSSRCATSRSPSRRRPTSSSRPRRTSSSARAPSPIPGGRARPRARRRVVRGDARVVHRAS